MYIEYTELHENNTRSMKGVQIKWKISCFMYVIMVE